MISKSWKELTNVQRQGWDQLAENATGQSVFGQKAQLSGMNLYVRLNSNLVMAGSAIRSDAPIGLDNVPDVQFGAMYVNSNSVRLESINEENDDYRLVVKMSNAQSTGVSNAWSRTVVVSSSEETDWGELDLTDAFADVLGTDVIDGQKYFVEIYWVDSVTGFTGPVMQISGIAGPNPIYGQSSGSSSRSIIRVKDYENDDRRYYKNFEFELSRGSVISTVKGEYGFKGTRSNSYIDLDNETAAKFVEQKCYVLSRGNYGSNWTIGFLDVEVRMYDQMRLGVSPSFSSQTYGAEAFDTAAPVTI